MGQEGDDLWKIPFKTILGVQNNLGIIPIQLSIEEGVAWHLVLLAKIPEDFEGGYVGFAEIFGPEIGQ